MVVVDTIEMMRLSVITVTVVNTHCHNI